jgi:nicotinamide mononucleotide transporter PnuC
MTKNKVFKIPMFWTALILLVVIISCGIIFKTHPIKVLPLCISCFVMFLQARVNRYAFLLGGLNSIIYAFTNITMKMYSSAASAFLMSFPLQIITFINWSKNTKNGETETKKLSVKMRLGLFGGMVSLWGVLYIVFAALDSPYMVLDNTVTVLGVVTTVLCMIRYSEYAILQLIGSFISLVTYIVLTVDDISNIVWIIYTAYSLVCTVIAFITMNKRSVQR